MVFHGCKLKLLFVIEKLNEKDVTPDSTDDGTERYRPAGRLEYPGVAECGWPIITPSH